ncbi:MAG TPA: hypothetical protein PLS60_04260 [Arenimonas sp.]|nr:hypothetical protein [Arenimonas sp.]
MKKRVAILFLFFLTTAFAMTSFAKTGSVEPGLVGAWHGKVQFSSGVLASIQDLEFMYVFNAGGTMTESSNHDSAPPVPPAYGVWRKTGARQYEAKYKFFWNNPPKAFEEIASGGGWPPGGSAVLLEKITLSGDGKSFISTLSFDVLDNNGAVIESGSQGEAQASRIDF